MRGSYKGPRPTLVAELLNAALTQTILRSPTVPVLWSRWRLQVRRHPQMGLLQWKPLPVARRRPMWEAQAHLLRWLLRLETLDYDQMDKEFIETLNLRSLQKVRPAGQSMRRCLRRTS